VKLILEDEAKKYMVASRKMQLASKKTLADATNRQMSFLLMRIFALMPPRRVQEQRAKVREYLNAQIGEARLNKKGKKVARAKLLRRVHLIVQARRRKAGMKGAYGKIMKDDAAALRRASVGSIGYLKSGFVALIRKFNGHFTQTGGTKTAKGSKVERTSPNAAFMKMLANYGLLVGHGNVAIHRGVKVAYNFPVMSLNPVAIAQISLKLKDGQEGKVNAMFDEATTTALHDERKEMERVIAARMQAVIEETAPRR
jgi:hypothetical protein